MKDFLNKQVFIVQSPRETIKQAFQSEYLKDTGLQLAEIWLKIETWPKNESGQKDLLPVKDTHKEFYGVISAFKRPFDAGSAAVVPTTLFAKATPTGLVRISQRINLS